MSSKKARKEEQRRKEEERLCVLHTKRLKQILGAMVSVGMLMALIWWGASNAPPYDWVQCFRADTSAPQQHKHFGLFMQVGERAGVLNV